MNTNKPTENETLRTGYAAARLEIESLRARSAEPAGEYPLLPEPVGKVEVSTTLENSGLRRHQTFPAYTSDQMRAYVDADRAMRAAQPMGAQQPGDCGNTPYDEGPFTLTQQTGDERASHGQAPAQAIGPCVICGSDEPFTGTCGSGGDPRALCKQPAPTPQADSQPALAPADSVTAPAGGADWQDISTAPKDGTRFVAVGQNYGLDSEKQHTCIAQWLAGCWVEVSDWNGASKLKYLTHWMPLPPLPGSAARAPADSVTASSLASHEKELEDALRERDESDEFIDTLLDEVLGADRAEWSSAYGRADALNDVQERMTTLHKPAVDKAWGRFQVAMATDSVLEDAARLDWLESQSQINIERVRYLGADESIYEVTPYNSTDYNGKTLRKAIDAAMAAARKQGANHD